MKIVGVSACPTGIAHTYLAKETMIKEATKRGHEIKIETQGSIGVEDELTMDDVNSADVVILAIAVRIDNQERFENKKVLQVDVNEAIRKPAEVFDKAEELAKK